MDNDTTIEFQNPAFRDEMTDLIRAHAQTAIRQAILAELDAFLGKHDDADPQGRRNVVRNGYQPERWRRWTPNTQWRRWTPNTQ